MNRTNEELNALFKQVVADMKAAGIYVPLERLVKLRFNAPMARAWGKCRYSRLDFGTYRCEISLSKALCQNGTERAFKRTAAHELIHLCHPGQGHGLSFKHEAAILQNAYPDIYDISRCTEASRVFENQDDMMDAFKFIITCPSCGQKWGYNKATQIVRFPETYHCRVCKVDLKRLK